MPRVQACENGEKRAWRSYRGLPYPASHMNSAAILRAWPRLTWLLLPFLGGCLGPGAVPLPEYREWVELSSSWMFRSGEDLDPLDNDAAFLLDGGVRLWEGKVSGSIEAGLGTARLDVKNMARGERNTDVYRMQLGGRLIRDFPDRHLSTYLRGGIFYRFNSEDNLSVEPFSQDGGGLYIGTGVHWWFTERYGIGPFVMLHRSLEKERLVETLVGLQLSVRFLGLNEDRYGKRRNP